MLMRHFFSVSIIWLVTYYHIAGAIMSAIYDEKKDEDGFLYVTYSGENTFGWQIMQWPCFKFNVVRLLN